MKAVGFGSLIAGWFLVLSSLVMLPEGIARGVFVAAGLAVEITGLVVVARAHRSPKGEAGALR